MQRTSWRWTGTLALAFGPPAHPAEPASAEPAMTVASYYFGPYHPNDPRNPGTHAPGFCRLNANLFAVSCSDPHTGSLLKTERQHENKVRRIPSPPREALVLAIQAK